MSWLKAGITFLVAFILQGSLLNMFSIAGHTPNLLLAFVVILSFLYDKELYGIVFGAVVGLIYDMCYSYILGPTPIALVVASICVIAMRYYANVENTVSMSVVSLISFIIYYCVNWCLYSIAGYPVGVGYAVQNSIITMLYTLIVNIIVYKVLIKDVVKHHKDRYFI